MVMTRGRSLPTEPGVFPIQISSSSKDSPPGSVITLCLFANWDETVPHVYGCKNLLLGADISVCSYYLNNAKTREVPHCSSVWLVVETEVLRLIFHELQLCSAMGGSEKCSHRFKSYFSSLTITRYC